MNPSYERSYAEQQDREDALSSLRSEFFMPKRADGTPFVYLCGHSLGLQPKAAAELMQEELAAWAHLGVEAHFHAARPWVSYHERLAPGLASLCGALPSEVVAMNSLTVNLHLMLASFYRPRGSRQKILIEKRAFSSDRYALASHSRGDATNMLKIDLFPFQLVAGISLALFCAVLLQQAWKALRK